MNFGVIIEALRNNKCATRLSWKDGIFVFKQVPSIISNEIIPKMQSVPDSAKCLLLSYDQDSIHYNNQIVIVNNRNIDSWNPTPDDLFAEDWVIVK